MKRMKAALAAGALVVSAGTVGVIASSSAGASIPDPEPVLVEQVYVLSPNEAAPVTVSCASGYTLLSGGYTNGSSPADVRVDRSSPHSTTAWVVDFKSLTGNGSRLVRAFAWCAELD